MKYWLLTSEYPPFYGGGISTYCQLSASMLAEKGHVVSVFVNDSSIKNVLVSTTRNIRVIRFNGNRGDSHNFLGHSASLSYEFAGIVKQFILSEGKPDIIEAQEYLGIAYYLMQFKHLQYDWCFDIPIVITAHSPSFLYLAHNHVPVYRYPNYWIGEMERFCLQAADLVFFPSQFLADEIRRQFNFNNPSVAIISNPYEVKETGNTSVPVANNEALFYGKLSAQKGTFKLLEYFLSYWNNGGKLKLRLVGGQDIVYHAEKKTMGDLIKRKYASYLKRGILQFEERIAPSQIAERLQQATVVIVPSTVDNLPYVVLEMMGMGHIVLVSKQGGQAEIVDEGIDGFIFDHEDAGSFHSQLQKILALTENERRIISIHAREKIKQRFAPSVIYAQKIAALNGLLQKKEIARSVFPFIRHTDRKPTVKTASRKGLLSVVIPYYNLGKYVDETISSVKKSDFPDKEIIIVDDGSTEEFSVKKLKQYENDQDIRIIQKRNEGLAAARNTGANAANGEYLAFLDADDRVEPTYYSKSVRVLKQYDNVDFVGAWTQYFDHSRKVWPTFAPEPPIILYHNIINSSSLVYKLDSFLSGGLNDGNMPFKGWEDYESVISLVAGGYHGVVLPEILFYYRVRPDSMIRSMSEIKKLEIWHYLMRKHKAVYGNFAGDIFNLSKANGAGLEMDNPSLDYDMMDRMPFGGLIGKKIIRLIKSNKRVRPLAYKIYRLFNK